MSSTKKTRVSDSIKNEEIPMCTSPLGCFPCREIYITDLPCEILSQVFRYFPYHHIAEQLRLVSKHFCYVATMVLNSDFATLGPEIERIMSAIDLGMSMSSDGDLLRMCRWFNFLEILENEVSKTT